METYTVRVYNAEGRNILTYDGVVIENDLDPPYAILKNVNGQPVALIPTSFIIEIVKA